MSVSFSLLDFNKKYDLFADQMAKHEIQKDGTSKLPQYSDSIFTVTHHTGADTWMGDRHFRTEQFWSVKRLKKGENLPPLDKPITMTCSKVSELEIQADGTSSRKDLKDYIFEYDLLGNVKGDVCYQIIMRKK